MCVEVGEGGCLMMSFMVRGQGVKCLRCEIFEVWSVSVVGHLRSETFKV